MKTNRHFRPALVGASALLLSACSYGGYSAPAATSSTAQVTTGTSELKRIADQLADSGDHEAAIPIYRYLGSRSGDAAALTALASSLIAQGAHSEGASILSTVVTRGQASGATWYNLGKAHLANGQFDEALLAFNKASAQIGQDPKVRSGRAIALAALGRTGQAIAAFQTASDRLTLSNKALVLAATGRAKAAILVLEAVMRQNGGTSRDRQNLAMAYLLAGQEQEAHRVARLDLDPVTINETFTFYRSLSSLNPAHRMQALVTGAVNPEWTRGKLANLALQESKGREDAAKRLVENNMAARTPKKKLLAAAPTPKPQPEPVSRADYVLTEVPPLVEPEGWALQIGAYRTIKNLMRGWTILYRKSGDILEGIPPRRSEVDFGKREEKPSGFYYRLNAGPLKTFAHAKELCSELKNRGTNCWIRPPEKTEGKLPSAQKAIKQGNNETLTVEANLKN